MRGLPGVDVRMFPKGERKAQLRITLAQPQRESHRQCSRSDKPDRPDRWRQGGSALPAERARLLGGKPIQQERDPISRRHRALACDSLEHAEHAPFPWKGEGQQHPRRGKAPQDREGHLGQFL